MTEDIKNTDNNNEKNLSDNSDNKNNEISNLSEFSYDLEKSPNSIDDNSKSISLQNINNSTRKEEPSEQKTNDLKKTELSDSNYQISLIDDHNLKIKVVTENFVSVDCNVKGLKSSLEKANKIQSNKILIHHNEQEKQEVEIIISIGKKNKIYTEKTKTITEENKNKSDKNITKDESSKLIPNPLVANLIQKFTRNEQNEEDNIPKTPEEKLEEKLGPKNPWILYRELIRINLIKGLISAVILFFIFSISFYSVAKKKNNDSEVIEIPRLIVLQDLPENQNLQQQVEDPNKPEDKEQKVDDDATDKSIPPIVPQKIKKPKITGPKIQPPDTTNKSDLTKELDSLIAVNQKKDSINKSGIDTSKFTHYIIPDSIKNNYSENDVGLIIGAYPKNWKLTDQREININEKEFNGVVLTDTTAKLSGTMSLFIHLDRDGKEFSREEFKNDFKMDDTTLIAFSKDPYTQAGFTFYKFYVFAKTDKINIDAQVREKFFNEYKSIIEAVVRSIRIQKPNTVYK